MGLSYGVRILAVDYFTFSECTRLTGGQTDKQRALSVRLSARQTRALRKSEISIAKPCVCICSRTVLTWLLTLCNCLITTFVYRGLCNAPMFF